MGGYIEQFSTWTLGLRAKTADSVKATRENRLLER